MKTTFKIASIALTTLLALTACKQDGYNNQNDTTAKQQSSDSNLGTSEQQTSYAMGMDIGRGLKEIKDLGFEVDLKKFNEGLETVLNGKETKINEKQAQDLIIKLIQEKQHKFEEKLRQEAKINLEKGDAFLKDNAKKEGIHTTSSGLQYQIKNNGTGKQPKASDIVTVEYEGRFIDGTVFDSSKQHGNQPVTLPLNQVIPGWTEGLQLMKEGAEYTFFIPAKLAYGERDTGDNIPSNSTLIFDIKLLKIEKK